MMTSERKDGGPAWFPIESAPKDGTSILTYPHYVVTSFNNHIGAFSVWSDYADEAIRLKPDPTHWQPLPEPPETLK